MTRLLLIAGCCTAAMVAAQAQPLIDFPTPNRALLEGKPNDFYMYVERDFEGKKSYPWEAGQFGFVRNPKRVGGRIIQTRHHEGIDIKPLHRDPAGTPLDPITAAAAGKVVYVNDSPTASNYGRYIVIEHSIGGSDYYSLYAHLASVAVEAGEPVSRGQKIGILGYTGSGLDRTRAHLHFEFGLKLSENFDAWHAMINPNDANPHGAYNGQNLAGMNPAALLLAARSETQPLDIPQFVRSQPAYYKVAIPNSPHFSLIKRYPWLAGQFAATEPPTWLVSFTEYGLPVAAEPLKAALAQPAVTWVKDSSIPYSSATKGIVTGPAGKPTLGRSGLRVVALLTMPPAAPTD